MMLCHDATRASCKSWQLCHGTCHFLQRGGGKLSEAEARSILIGLGPALPPPTMAGLEGLKTAVPQILPEVGRSCWPACTLCKSDSNASAYHYALHFHPLHSLSHLCRAFQACVGHAC